MRAKITNHNPLSIFGFLDEITLVMCSEVIKVSSVIYRVSIPKIYVGVNFQL